MGAAGRHMTVDMTDAGSQAADILFLIKFAKTLKNVDAKEVAVIGYSWGGTGLCWPQPKISKYARWSFSTAHFAMDRYHPLIWPNSRFHFFSSAEAKLRLSRRGLAMPRKRRTHASWMSGSMEIYSRSECWPSLTFNLALSINEASGLKAKAPNLSPRDTRSRMGTRATAGLPAIRWNFWRHILSMIRMPMPT
jgi:hypothetical protein